MKTTAEEEEEKTDIHFSSWRRSVQQQPKIRPSCHQKQKLNINLTRESRNGRNGRNRLNFPFQPCRKLPLAIKMPPNPYPPLYYPCRAATSPSSTT